MNSPRSQTKTKPTAPKKSAAARKSKQPASSGSLRQDLKRFTRERLIAAAMECFMRDGYRATTVEQIVELAGTTTPTFYRHFSSKNDLLKPLQEHLKVEVRKSIEPLNTIKFEQSEIRAWLDVYLEMWRRVHRLCTAYWEACELDDELAADPIQSSLAFGRDFTQFQARFEPHQREAAIQRLAILVPVLDRVMKTVTAQVDPALQEKLLWEFSGMFLASLTFPPGE